ncbi:hypothetical protein HYU06_00745 [Candidatus Woesearchaeota archaeon]|nr:hypothetical protein [Candidatus Woesearchaeota archaeon]
MKKCRICDKKISANYVYCYSCWKDKTYDNTSHVSEFSGDGQFSPEVYSPTPADFMRQWGIINR